MADATVDIQEPAAGDVTARLDAESRTVAGLLVLLERIRIAGDGERYMDVNAAMEGLVHDADVLAAVQAVTAAIAAGIVVSGSVALDAATLAALETINAVVTGSVSVSNFPASVALDAATLAALETINAVVSGTVALDAPTLAALETITVANMIPAVETGLAKEVTLATRLSEATFLAEDFATAAHQVTQNAADVAMNASLDAIEADADAIRLATEALATDSDVALSTRASEVTLDDARDQLVALLAAFNAEDFATQTTLAAVLTRANLLASETKLEAVRALLAGTLTVDVTDAFALEATQTTALARLTSILAALDVALSTRASEATLATRLSESAFTGRVPDEAGTWAYHAGVSGAVAVPAGERVIGIAAIATAAGASFDVNGGDSIPVPENIGVDLAPRGNVTAPTITFVGTVSYVVETVSA